MAHIAARPFTLNGRQVSKGDLIREEELNGPGQIGAARMTALGMVTHVPDKVVVVDDEATQARIDTLEAELRNARARIAELEAGVDRGGVAGRGEVRVTGEPGPAPAPLPPSGPDGVEPERDPTGPAAPLDPARTAAVDEPPRGGAGATRARWAAFAEANGINVEPDMGRDDIVEIMVERGRIAADQE